VSQWNGFSPRDTQRYLCNVWAKVRAAISRAGFHVFGFRVVESHHDGTPHWHMLRFIRPHDVEAVRDILAITPGLPIQKNFKPQRAYGAFSC
jgi:hypothetical protein